MFSVRAPRRSPAIVVMLVCIIVALGVACVVLFLRYQQAQGDSQKEFSAAQLADSLSGTIQLPQGNPSLVTILDRTKLGDPLLAAEAHNGDALLVYGTAGRVILYRPSTKKVINMFHMERPADTINQSGAPNR
jgi:hypothetical protein